MLLSALVGIPFYLNVRKKNAPSFQTEYFLNSSISSYRICDPCRMFFNWAIYKHDHPYIVSFSDFKRIL